MILPIPSGGHVENDSRFSFLLSPLVCILQAELRFSNSRGTQHNRHGAWQESPVQKIVQSGNAGLLSCWHRVPGGKESCLEFRGFAAGSCSEPVLVPSVAESLDQFSQAILVILSSDERHIGRVNNDEPLDV